MREVPLSYQHGRHVRTPTEAMYLVWGEEGFRFGVYRGTAPIRKHPPP